MIPRIGDSKLTTVPSMLYLYAELYRHQTKPFKGRFGGPHTAMIVTFCAALFYVLFGRLIKITVDRACEDSGDVSTFVYRFSV